MNTPCYRIYAESSDLRALLSAMDVCIHERIPFYYSGRRRVIRAQTRNQRKTRELDREFKARGLRTQVTWYD